MRSTVPSSVVGVPRWAPAFPHWCPRSCSWSCSARLVGGTSLAAPIWAALTALRKQFLVEHGGKALGNLNPLLAQRHTGYECED
jgi:hypothetical protein